MSLINNQTFPGDVNITDDLRVNSSTLSIRADSGRVGINKLSPGQELDVVGNAHVSSNLTVSTNKFHVNVDASRVGIGTTLPVADFEAFPGENSKFAVMGRVLMGRSTRYPAFGHIDTFGSDGDRYGFLQDNTLGDTYFNSNTNRELYFTYLNTALCAFYKKNFGVGTNRPSQRLHIARGQMKQNLPYIFLHAPSASITGGTNFINTYWNNGAGTPVKFYEAKLSNRLTLASGGEKVTIPSGCKGLYRIYCTTSISVGGSSSREFGFFAFNRSSFTGIGLNNGPERVTSGTYNQICLDYVAVCNEGDDISWRCLPDPNEGGIFAQHYPNSYAIMYMIKPIE